jgi:hypothetical protein
MSTYRLDTGSVADWQITQRLGGNCVRIESPTLATHMIVRLSDLIATGVPSGPVAGGGGQVEATPSAGALPAAIVPAARATDPATSHEAAATAKAAAAENRIRVLMAHEAAGGDGLTGDELEQRTGTPYAVIGPRRPWLVDNEFLVQSGVRLNRRGNREQVFVITDAGRDMAQRLRAEGKAS